MEDAIKDYIHFLQIEKGLADNSIASYRRDLNQYIKFLEKVEGLKEVGQIERHHIREFLKHLNEAGKSSSSIARMISTIRSFHKFIIQEFGVKHDASLHIQNAKKGTYLTKSII